ncbi:hypothetical protein Avbf_17358 [Armadillidium vulgare]|nr:hypothetical protein Avbf_17358 [Armadillidium vulgare]
MHCTRTLFHGGLYSALLPFSGVALYNTNFCARPLSSSGRLSSYGVSYSIFEKKPGCYRSSSAHGLIDKNPVVFRVLNRRTFKRRWTFPCTAVQEYEFRA